MYPKHFPNCGYIQFKLNQSQLYQVNQEIQAIQSNFDAATPWQSHLAGNLQREYKLSEDTRSDLERHLLPVVDQFDRSFGMINNEVNSIFPSAPVLSLGISWVNFQKKNEFNPVHNHDGVLSFALWIKIPFKMEDELKNISSTYSNTPVPGNFQFVYTSAIGGTEVYSIPCDQSMEGYGVLFSSKQQHCVYPFTSSDDYRISVSGNFYFKESA